MSFAAFSKPIVLNRPVWLILDRYKNRRFGVTQTAGKETAKTALVAFVQRSDALFMARSLEEFHRVNGRYPRTNFDDKDSEIQHLRSPTTRSLRMRALDLEGFDSMSHLEEYARMSFLDVCVCEQVIRDGRNFELRGRFVDVGEDLDACRAACEFNLDARLDTDAYMDEFARECKPRSSMGVSSSAPEARRSSFVLVFSPWRSDAPELLAAYRKCVEQNHAVADFDIVNALASPPKPADRAAAGPPPYVLRDGKPFLKAVTPANIQKLYNECSR